MTSTTLTMLTTQTTLTAPSTQFTPTTPNACTDYTDCTNIITLQRAKKVSFTACHLSKL